MRDGIRRPSPALVLSLVAVFLSLGGGAYAAFGPGSVGTRALKQGAVTKSKIRAKAVTRNKIAPRAVGPAQLGNGALGAAVAYARIPATGGVDESRSRGITDDNFLRVPPAQYCFYDLPDYRTAVAIPLTTADPEDIYLRSPLVTVSLDPKEDGLCTNFDDQATLAVITRNLLGPEAGPAPLPFNLVLFK